MNRYVVQDKKVIPILEKERQILELECSHCGEIVERMHKLKQVSCFGCKTKRHKKYGEEKRKAAKQS